MFCARSTSTKRSCRDGRNRGILSALIVCLRRRKRSKRQGAVTSLAAILMVVMCGLLAFAIDLGYVVLVQTQAQACADSAALAGATATATALYDTRISGFRKVKEGLNCSIMPFVVERDEWIDKIANGNGKDEWTYEKEGRIVARGRDGICEVKMYPTHVGQAINGRPHGAGNFGTVDIGNLNNSTPDLERQIRYGPSAADLQSYGGVLQLDEETETLTLFGDTGLSAALKDPLEDIVGLPRTIMLYDQVGDSGDNTNYRIVGFVGVTVVDINLISAAKYVTVQPTLVTDPTAVTGESRGQNYYVGHSVRLVR